MSLLGPSFHQEYYNGAIQWRGGISSQRVMTRVRGPPPPLNRGNSAPDLPIRNMIKPSNPMPVPMPPHVYDKNFVQNNINGEIQQQEGLHYLTNSMSALTVSGTYDLNNKIKFMDDGERQQMFTNNMMNVPSSVPNMNLLAMNSAGHSVHAYMPLPVPVTKKIIMQPQPPPAPTSPQGSGSITCQTKRSAVDIEKEINGQNLYKTELCRSFIETGACRYGSKCQFAHGRQELRPVLRHPKYKTEICKTFHTIGTCPYGTRCRFIHKKPDAEVPDNSVIMPSPSSIVLPDWNIYTSGETKISPGSPPPYSANGSPVENRSNSRERSKSKSGDKQKNKILQQQQVRYLLLSKDAKTVVRDIL